MLKIIRYMRSAVSFFTIIPMGNSEFLPEALYFLWLPYVISGIISFLILYLIQPYVSHFAMAIVGLSIIGIVHGAQNLDSLLDLGDGLMKRGPVESKFSVMKDPSVGAGGIFIFFVVYGISISALFSVSKAQMPGLMLFSQLVDIAFMAIIFFKNKPAGEGYGKFFSTISSKWLFLVISYGIPFFLTLIIFSGYLYLFAFLTVIALILRVYLTKIFRGVNGDIVGASGEIGRMFALLLSTVPIIAF